MKSLKDKQLKDVELSFDRRVFDYKDVKKAVLELKASFDIDINYEEEEIMERINKVFGEFE